MNGSRWIDTHGNLQARGRTALRVLLNIVEDSVPDADPPVLQVKSVVWRRRGGIWLRCYTDTAHQIALELPPLKDVSAEELADALGISVFDHTTSMSEKLALPTSVGLSPAGRMRIIVKHPDDLRANKSEWARLLRRSWSKLG